MPPDSAETAALRARTEGRARTGTVGLRDFDKGIVETLGAVVSLGPDKQPGYWLALEGVQYAPGLPGIPVVMAFPEDVFKTSVIPMIVIRRDDITPSMGRWHPGTLQYRTTGSGALPAGPATGPISWDRFEELQQATPFDIMYTVHILARDRSARFSANVLLNHVLRVFPPYGTGVFLHDSLGDVRTYEVFNRGMSNLDRVPEVADRVIGFAVSLDVEAELDLTDPYTQRATTKNPNFSYGGK